MIRMKRALVLALALATLAALLPLAGGTVLAQSGNTWYIDYYNNPDWSGNPVSSQTASMIWFDWGYGAPQNCNPDNFTARMRTNAFFYGGVYQFQIQADDDFLLLIDGVNYWDTRGQGQPNKTFVIPVNMWQGNHNIQIDYREWTQTAYIFVNWSNTGSGGYAPPPPPSNSGTPPFPPQPAELITNFGNFTDCMKQNIHQVHCFNPAPGTWPPVDQGSINSEPQIVGWTMCGDEQVEWFQEPGTGTPKQYKCSKTDAGYYPN